MPKNLKWVVVVLCACAVLGSAWAVEIPKNIHWWVVQHTENGQKADFFIVLKSQANLAPARSLPGKEDKGRFVFSALTQTAEETQAPLRTWLDTQGVKYQSFWIVNMILVRDGDRELALAAAERPDVERIEGNPSIKNELPTVDPSQVQDLAGHLDDPRVPETVEWNITKVNAPSVWALGFHGEGVVVGGQDTGIRWTHSALKSKYRGWDGTTASHDYNWHDSIHSTTQTTCPANQTAPCDDQGHGTHTMGTVLGDDGGTNQVGMAPGAKWIACRNMDAGVGTPATYLECFQFFLAPTKIDGSNPDPTKAPDVTNNSWGCPTDEGCSWDTLQTAVDNQKAAGIMTVVSAGNDGSSCNSVLSPPAVYAAAYSVGATTSSDSMAYYSSRGYATGTNLMKPDIVAPGSGVKSAYYTSDTSYTSLDGTSMAGPHVAGAVALLWSARACFMNRQDATQVVINNSALDLPGIVESCGGNYTTGPNNTWGNGRLDILAAYNAGCPCTTPGVPSIGTASVPGDNQITISWTAGSPAANTYNVYRSPAACPGGTFTKIQTGLTASPWTDIAVSGGSTYSYKVTAVDSTGGCESALSGCVSATATGACTLPPAFAGLASVVNPGESTCTLNLAWNAASSNCGSSVKYNVYRSTISGFTPSPANRIATGVTMNSYADAVGIVRGTTYYYVVRAVDAGNAVEETNTVQKSGVPTGPITTSSWIDTFETTGGFDQAGWTHGYGTGSTDWTWSTAYAHDGTHSWFAQDMTSASDMWLESPAFGVGGATTMSFWHTYAFESTSTCYDGGTLEWSADGTTWSVVPATDFTAGAYNGTIYATSNPIYNKAAWCGGTIGTLTQVSLNLAADPNLLAKTIQVRWHEGSDSSVAATGWYVDTVAVNNAQIGGACEVGSGCATPPEAPVAQASTPQTNRIAVNWNDSSMASVASYKVYRSTTSGGPYTQIASMADTSPGVPNGPSYTYNDDTVSGGTHYYYVVRSTDGVACTSVNSNQADAIATGNCLLPPSFTGVTGVSNPGVATCTLDLAWTAGTSNCSTPLTYNVYRGTTSGFTPSSANRIATGVIGTAFADAVGIGNMTTYYYVVRAVDSGSGIEEANTTQKSGAPTGPGSITSWTDTFEGSLSGGGFDLAGWTHSAVSGSTNWVWSTTQPHDGTHSWYAQDISGVSDMVLTTPSFDVGATTTMTFWHTYAFEGSTSTCYDGGTLEYTIDGTTWTVVPATDFTSGGYTGTIGSSYSNPLGGKPGWCAGTVGTPTQVAVNLGADANLLGHTIRLRWHEGNDSSVSATGWYVDSVTLNNAGSAAACTAGACTAPGSMTGLSYATVASGLHWTAAPGATGYDLVRGTVSTLHSGGFTPSTNACLANDIGGTAFRDTHVPAAGDADWFLVRFSNTCGVGTWDEPAGSQVGSRDAAIAASTNACP